MDTWPSAMMTKSKQQLRTPGGSSPVTCHVLVQQDWCQHATCGDGDGTQGMDYSRDAPLARYYGTLFRGEKSGNMEGKKGGHVKSGKRGKIDGFDQKLGGSPPQQISVPDAVD